MRESEIKMARLSSDIVGPPRTLELFRMFLDASSKGVQAELLLETRRKTVTSKFWCVESFSGDPVEAVPRKQKRKENPSRARRSRLRMEQFQIKKKKERSMVAGGPSTTISSDTSNEVVKVLDSSKGVDRTAGPQIASISPIPQVDGTEDKQEVVFTFQSDYVEKDILDSFTEIFPGTAADLTSRVRVSPRSADHFCMVVLNPVHPRTFSWPAMDPENTKVFREIRRQK